MHGIAWESTRTWQATGEFRWKRRPFGTGGVAFQHYEGAFVADLQQAYCCLETHEIEWRDVPITDGP